MFEATPPSASWLGATGTALVLVLAFARPAHADEAAAHAAAREYDAAAAAYDRGDHAAAAAGFARADELVPNPRVLQLGLAAALAGNDAPLGMTLVERAESRKDAAGPIAELAKRVRKKFTNEAGRLRVVCPEAAKCAVSVDGRNIETSSPVWLATGSHAVSVKTDAGAKLDRDVVISPGAIAEVVIAEAKGAGPRIIVTAPTTPPRKEEARDGLPPWLFWTGVGATIVGAGVSTALTLDVKSKHDDFQARPSAESASAGDSAQTRARIGWVVTGVLAAATVVVFVLTDFRGTKTSAALAVSPQGAFVQGRF